jgi:hypothetical protein
MSNMMGFSKASGRPEKDATSISAAMMVMKSKLSIIPLNFLCKIHEVSKSVKRSIERSVFAEDEAHEEADAFRQSAHDLRVAMFDIEEKMASLEP